MKMVDIIDDKQVMNMLSYIGNDTAVLQVYIVGGTMDEVVTGAGIEGESVTGVEGESVTGVEGESVTGVDGRSVTGKKQMKKAQSGKKQVEKAVSVKKSVTGKKQVEKEVSGKKQVEKAVIQKKQVEKKGSGKKQVEKAVTQKQQMEKELSGKKQVEKGVTGVGQEGEVQTDDMSDLPSVGEDEEDTDDDMSSCGLLDEHDEEYTQAREKKKQASVRTISDELFTNQSDSYGEAREVISDYDFSNEDIVSDSTDEEDEGARMRQRHQRIVYDPKCDHKTFKLKLGMQFSSGLQARDALTDNAVENGWEIHFKRATEEQVEANCKEPCKWRCYGSEINKSGGFQVRQLYDIHTCSRKMKNKIVTANWIARKYMNVFRLKPDITIKELGRDLVQRYAHDASRWKLYNAKKKVIELLTGFVQDHYAKLRSYLMELMRVDREGRFELDVDVGSVFKSVYTGFSGLRKGFMMGCRRVIGLDGAFLKTYLGGVLLTAVGTDGNNQMFPIAWAVVQVEK